MMGMLNRRKRKKANLAQTNSKVKPLFHINESAIDDDDDVSHLVQPHAQEREERIQRPMLRQPEWLTRTRKDPLKFVRDVWNNSKCRNVLKCSLAYLIASLVVYTPFGNVYGVSDNKHMVATVATYFNPARTSGSMTEATIYVAYALTYSFLLSVMSMIISMFFYDMHIREVGYVIDIVVFCGVGIGLVIYMKFRMKRPTFNTASTVACISLITVLTREGMVQNGLFGYSKLVQNFALVGSGIVVTTFVCYTLWPQSAVKELKKSLTKSMSLYSSTLDGITEAFIKGSNINTAQFDKLLTEMNSCYQSLEKHVSDSRFELFAVGREKEQHLLHKMVSSCHRLASHIDGLKSSAVIQWYLLREDLDSSTTNTSDSGSVISMEGIASMASRDTLQPTPADLQASTSSQLFHLFVYHLGPPLRSFSYTLREILDTIPFGPGPKFDVCLDRKVRPSLQTASCVYATARAKALSQLYAQDVFNVKNDVETMAGEEGVAASCGNFSYVLEAFGVELEHFVSLLEEYDQLQKINPTRTFNWLKFWRRSAPVPRDDLEQLMEDTEATLEMHKKTYVDNKKGSYRRGIGYKIWKGTRLLRRTDVRFGIKVGIGAAIFAIPAFLDKFRPIFGRWRGEWGLITYSIIMAKSIGGTLTTVKIRIGGTTIGALISLCTWTLFPANPYMLAFVGWLLALPCFWIILHWPSNNPFGRFILLTYNITALYSYSLSVHDDEDDDDEGGDTGKPIIGDIAFHRFVSVSVGTLWALFINIGIWPNSARSQFKKLLAVQWLRMGLVWKSDPLKADKHEVRGIHGGHELRATMIELRTLLTQASQEIRLKGPYPVKEYKSILASTQRVLDMYENMSVLVAKYRNPSQREIEIIDYTSEERKEICSRLFLFFYLISSAVKTGFPLPDKLPSTEHAVDRMLAKLNEFRQEAIESQRPPDEEDFVLFYSYILATITIAEELAKIAITIQEMYGLIEDEMLELTI